MGDGTKDAAGACDPIPPGTDREFALDWLRQFNGGRDISEAIVRLRMELTALQCKGGTEP